jgi:uracil-DNA glycosylase
VKKALRLLVEEVKACTVCAEFLPLGPRPVFQIDNRARILVAGQAPGTKVHESGVPFNDPSGDRLRDWMGIDRDTFYDASRVALLPMGFCYPGRGKSGDLPPRPECARTWRQPLMDHLPNLALTLVVGQYSQAWYFADSRHANLTERVKDWRSFGAAFIPLPHPSPRNNIWLKKNAWFQEDLLPDLRRRVGKVLENV